MSVDMATQTSDVTARICILVPSASRSIERHSNTQVPMAVATADMVMMAVAIASKGDESADLLQVSQPAGILLI